MGSEFVKDEIMADTGEVKFADTIAWWEENEGRLYCWDCREKRPDRDDLQPLTEHDVETDYLICDECGGVFWESE